MFFGNFTPDNNNWLVLGKLATRSKISHLLLTGILKIKKETALPFRSTPTARTEFGREPNGSLPMAAREPLGSQPERSSAATEGRKFAREPLGSQASNRLCRFGAEDC